jgi:hypothetical protein
MDRLLDAIEMAADLRTRSASKYPNDKRNEEAIAGLQRLAETVSDVSEERAAVYKALWDNDCDGGLVYRAVELEGEMLRQVGFSEHWGTAEEFIAELVKRAGRRPGAYAA